MWYQRSQANWLVDGDRNTKYYHMKILSRKRFNKVRMLKDEQGKWIEDEDNIKIMMNDYYRQLFELHNTWAFGPRGVVIGRVVIIC